MNNPFWTKRLHVGIPDFLPARSIPKRTRDRQAIWTMDHSLWFYWVYCDLVSKDTFHHITPIWLFIVTKAHKRVDNLRKAIHTSENLRDLNLNQIAINHFQDLFSAFYSWRDSRLEPQVQLKEIGAEWLNVAERLWVTFECLDVLSWNSKKNLLMQLTY